MKYDDIEAVIMVSQGTFRVEVVQTTPIELSPFRLDEPVTVGEASQMEFQVMNPGQSDLDSVNVEIYRRTRSESSRNGLFRL